jgi:hypothetical protein
MKVLTIQQDQFSRGLQLLNDDSKAPFGSARKMLNCMITDRGGIAPRPGTALVGSHNTSASVVRGLYNFRKSKSNPDILIKTYDDEVEYYHPTLREWARLKDGFTTDKEFDFTYSLVNTDNDDFSYFNNQFEEYQRWSGAYTQLNGVLSGGETEITVDSVLNAQIYESQTATSNSATTVDVSTASWSTDMFKNFYIYFPSTGKIRLITANTGTQITFATLGAGPGNIAFEIRQLDFPISGSIIYNGTVIAYTTLDVATEFPVTSAHAGADNAPVAVVPTAYVAAPRGNRIDVLRGRVYVGNVRSALSRDSSGNLQASTQAGSVFVSKLLDPTTFTFSASRVAGEGDMLNIAYGGGDVTDLQGFEDEMAIYKRDYIELVKYTEDVNDTAIRTPLKTGVGSVGRVIKGTDDHYFMTQDKKYTSLGRVRAKDTTPQSENLGYSVKRLLDTYDHDGFTGKEFNNRIISTHQSEDATKNDVMLVYNKKTKTFEGIWDLGANNLEMFQENNVDAPELLYGESNGANVWKMFQDKKADVRDSSTELPYSAIWQSNFFNVLPIKSNVQAINSFAVEGYIAVNTTFTCKLFKDFESDSSVSFEFGGVEDDFMQGTLDLGRFFGSHPFATEPTGTISAPDADGRRRFSFIVYFPYQYCQYLSTEFSSTGIDQNWEIIRASYGLKESISTRTSNTKTI